MKVRTLACFLLFIFAVIAALAVWCSSRSDESAASPVGIWKFETPGALLGDGSDRFPTVSPDERLLYEPFRFRFDPGGAVSATAGYWDGASWTQRDEIVTVTMEYFGGVVGPHEMRFELKDDSLLVDLRVPAWSLRRAE